MTFSNGDLSPAFNDRELLGRGQLLEGGEIHVGCCVGRGESVVEFLGRAAGSIEGVKVDPGVGSLDRLETPRHCSCPVALDPLPHLLALLDGGRLWHGVGAATTES